MTDTSQRTPDSPLAGKRVLVVEDEFLITLDIERVLESVGITAIVTVGRNRDALGALQGERFDFAILDYRLDGDTSTPVAIRLGELDVPYIFLTGASALMVPAHFRAVPIVTKPFEAETLLGAIRKAIGRR
jgi:CheY-like chemotaxis protein